MASAFEKLDNALRDPLACNVYLFASTEQAMLHEAAAKTRRALLAGGAEDEVSRIDGPVPDMGEVVAASGAISFFGTRRVVELWEISTSTMKDKDVEELAALFGEVENAVLVVTVLHKDKKAAATKKAKLLMDAAAKSGFAAEIAKPTRAETLRFIAAQAQKLGATFAPGAAEALLDRAGDDRPLLENEVAKLAAVCGYGQIDRDAVAMYATHNVEADVFEMVRAITAGRKREALYKLDELLGLRHEPIAIAAALAGSYVDMLRVRVGIEAKKNLSVIFSEMGYKGSDWRLQKAKENAARYTTANLQQCVLCLAGLDRQLKSSALPDKSILLQAAVGELILLEKR